MKSLQEIENIVGQVQRLVKTADTTEIKLNANGGNSILLVYPPEKEDQFIEVIKKAMDKDRYELIDVNKVLIEFIEFNKSEIIEKFDLLQSSVSQIFKAPEEETENDFFTHLISKIQKAFIVNKVPFLYSTGSLYGTGIDNIQIIEHKSVMNSKIPLIILYPATEQDDKLLFLNSRPASKYRCMIIK